MKRSYLIHVQVILCLIMLAMLIPLPANLTNTAEAAGTVVTYPAPTGAALSNKYSVTVEGQTIDLYESTSTSGSKYAFGYFDMSGSASVSVQVNYTTISNVDIRPTSYGITPTVSGNTISFNLSQPRKISIEINGDSNQNLILFANPLEVNPPQPGDPDVIYFGPGIHELSDILFVKSNQTVYIAGGAIVKGRIHSEVAQNITIRGRGILDGSEMGKNYEDNRRGFFLRFLRSHNVNLEGIIVHDSPHWTIVPVESSDITIENIKILGYRDNNDAFDITNSSEVYINDVFVRTKDDAFAAKGKYIPGGERKNTENVTVMNSTFWNEAAGNGLEIGFETSAEYLRNIVFQNIDLIHHKAGAVFSIHNGDNGTVENVLYEDIRVEHSTGSKFIDMFIKNSTYSKDTSRGHIKNITFHKIYYTGSLPSNLVGYNSSHQIENVTFDELYINGNLILDAASANMTIGSHVANVSFVNSNTGNSVQNPPTAQPPSSKQTGGPNIAPFNIIDYSSETVGYEAVKAVDGMLYSKWKASSGFPQYIELDFRSNININKVELVGYLDRAYQYKIEAKPENGTYVTVVDRTSNQTQGTRLNPITDSFGSTSARYVKLTITGVVEPVNTVEIEEFRVFADSQVDIPYPSPTGFLNEHFNSDVTGQAPEGWTVNGTAVVSEVPSITDKSLKMEDTSSSSKVEARKNFVTTSGVIETEYQVMASQTNGVNGFHLRNATGISGVTIALDSNGYLYTYNGNSKINIQTYSPNTWYTIKVVADTSTDQFDVYIDGVQKVSQYHFRNNLSELSEVYMNSGTSTLGTVYYNNIQQFNPDLYQASSDFSTTQGTREWFYQAWDGSVYTDMTWNSTTTRWEIPQTYTQIQENRQHPDVQDSVRKWVAPKDGDIRISGFAKKHENGGDGVNVKILHNSTLLWNQDIASNDTIGQSFDLDLTVSEGDAIYFKVNKKSTSNYDWTILDPTIEYESN